MDEGAQLLAWFAAAADGGGLSSVLTALLSVGAAGVIWTLVKGWLALRGGAAGRESDAWKQIKDHNRYLDDMRRVAEADRDYYHSVCNRYYGQLVRHGLDPDPKSLRPPSDKEPGRHTSRTRGRPPEPDPDSTQLM